MANIALITNNILSDSGTALTSVLSGSGTTNYLSKFTGSTALGNSIIYDNGSAVGIGTTSPSYTLDVNGTARINSTLTLTSSTYAGTFSFYLSAANTLIGNSSNIGNWLQVGGGNRVYIVGQEFNSTSRGNIFGNTVGGEAISATTIIAQSSGTTATTGLSLRYTINNTGTYSGITRGIYYNPTVTSLTGTTHRAIETVVGDVIFGSTSGNVGIGTASPTARLTVAGQGTGKALIGDAGFGSNNYTAISLNGILTTGDYNILSSPTDATVYINRPSGAQIRFREANGVDQVTIATGGNVLIGTSTDAGYKLQVNGDELINNGNLYVGTLGSAYPGLITNGGPNSTNSYYGSGQGNGSWDSRPNGNAPYIMQYHTGLTFSANSYYGGIRFYNQAYPNIYSSTLVMSVVNDAVGIGTTSPTSKLNVIGDIHIGNYSTASQRVLDLRTSNSLFTITTDGTTGSAGTIISYSWANGGQGPLKFNNAAGEVMRLASNGNVGIGTTSPSYKLDVNGSLYWGNPSGEYMYAGGGGHKFAHSTSTGNWLYSGGSTGLRINNAADTINLAIITDDGNVGIGTTSPTEKLSVNGNMAFPKSGNTFIYNDQSGADSITIGGASYFSVKTFNGANYIEVFRATSTNNLLIGTTTDAGQKLQVNGSGNFNLGNSGYIKLQSGSGQRHGFIQSAFSNFLFSNNVYYDGSNWRYDQNGYGAQIQTETLSTGVIAFNTFASGTGGSVATIIESMRIANSGNILMGDPNDYGFKLQVNGTSIFSDTIIQDYGSNPNASRGITSYIAQSNLTNDYTNGFYSGETISGELASTVVAGQVVAMRASTLQWELADASTAASIGKNMLGIACYGGNSTDVITILLNGFFASNTYYGNSSNYGVPMYLNASTNGSLTDVAPSTTGNIVRIVGHVDDYSNANSCTIIRFNPDNSWLVI